MFVAIKENLKTMIDAGLKGELDALLERKELTLTAFVENVVRWFIEQDDVVQSMVVGQLRPSPDLAELVLRRLASRGSASRTDNKRSLTIAGKGR